ncbi:MAG: exosortase E/protease, VPEID-CTERM system [Terracidiphilus sp.]
MPSLVPLHLLGRLYLFAGVLAADSLLVSSTPHGGPILGPVASFGVVAFAVFVGLGYSKLKTYREEVPFNAWFFFGHLLLIFGVCLGNLAGMRGFGPQVNSLAGQFAERGALLLGVGILALAVVPLRSWISTARTTSPLWFFAVIAGVAASVLRYPFQSFWSASKTGVVGFLQAGTFRAVHAVLQFLIPGLIANPSDFTIGTRRFMVIIMEQCSGMEGIGLVLVFTTVWLAYFRKESRFPQALLLIPCALVCAWLLNIVRICSLILIGDAGAPDVAMVGFHSQAGWIAFTAIAFAFSMATRKLSWVRRIPSYAAAPGGDSVRAAVGIGASVAEQTSQETGESPAIGAYLVPFLAILAASFVSRAASGYFEWLYPLRFVAAALAIWFFRDELKKLNWRFGGLAPLTGTAIFLLWIVSAWWAKNPEASPLGQALAALSPAARITWIAFRVAAAGLTVPLAEELAFRGYLTRRLIDREFDTVPFLNVTMISMVISSVVFGLLYGDHWLTGMIAGMAYALVLKWRGRMGDAVVAHATSNLLLAVWVLARGDWAQW